MNQIVNSFVLFANSRGGSANLATFAKHAEVSPAAALVTLSEAVKDGLVEVSVVQKGEREIAVASLTKRAARKFNKARRASVIPAAQLKINTILENLTGDAAFKGTRIKAIVEATGLDRNLVNEALRAGRDADTPVYHSENLTGSNFHVHWKMVGDAFAPVPEPVQAELETETAEAPADEAPESTEAE